MYEEEKKELPLQSQEEHQAVEEFGQIAESKDNNFTPQLCNELDVSEKSNSNNIRSQIAYLPYVRDYNSNLARMKNNRTKK